MAIVKTRRIVGNLGTTYPTSIQTEEDRQYIRQQYVSTGKLKIEAPQRTIDANGNITETSRKLIFADVEALKEFNEDPVLIAMRERSSATYSSLGAVVSTD